jgi:hypothetical protein
LIWTARRQAATFRTSTLVLAFLAVFSLAGVAAPAPTRATDPAAEAARMDAYWTGERFRAAIPRDLVLPASFEGGGETTGGVTAAPAAIATVDGAAWTAGGAILQRSGVIFFTLDDADYSCSGSVVTDAGDPAYSLVVTAAHCAYDEGTDHFATNWTYIPAFDSNPAANGCDETPYGCWDARALVVHDGWTKEEALTVEAARHDYAVAVVGPVRNGSLQLDSLGAYPIAFTGVDVGDDLYAFGYPAQSPYDGEDLIYCAGASGVDPLVGSRRLLCDMTGGASGGPWLHGTTNPATASGSVASVSSYRLIGGDYLYGPAFDGSTRAVYDKAKAVTPDASGIDHHIVTGGASVTPFTDINGSTFKADIEWLYLQDITRGCAPTLFCPAADVSREQMAAFLVRAFDLPPTGTDYFTDDDASTMEAEINALRASQITTGCAVSRYCPKADVTREQMAAFLVRALDLPAATTDYFTDDETSTFEADINALAKAGITTGCTATTFCPRSNVSREQMAGFLHRAVGD